MAQKFAFKPDYAVPPGATLKETLEAKGISQSDLSLRTGLTQKTISQIANGVAPISYETAEKLELATGVSSTFWNRREASYRQALVRKEETERLEQATDWLKEIPLKELTSRSFVDADDDKVVLVRESLRFFGVSSVEAWRETWSNPVVQYRGKKSQERYPGFVAAWLRMGEIQAEAVECSAFDGQAFRRALEDVRELTTEKPSSWNTALPRICSEAGVAVVFTKQIQRAGVSGATKWLTKDKALIQLSLRYKTADQLWFTFFHEAGHILMHGKKRVFLEFGSPVDSDEEDEADVFARDFLIPAKHASELALLKSKAQIRRFVNQIGIAPGIVVGRLQKEGLLPHSHCNDLKTKLKWTDSTT